MKLSFKPVIVVVFSMTVLSSLFFIEPAVAEEAKNDERVSDEVGALYIDREPKDDLFDPSAPDEAENDELGSETPTDWNGMLGNSFGLPGELDGEYKPAVPVRDTEVLPPTAVNTQLINESSLPLLLVFGNDDGPAEAWPKGKSWLTGLQSISRMYDFRGCKFSLKTGPISIAHYLKSGSEFIITSDSLRSMTNIAPLPGYRTLYLSANADLFPEIDQNTVEICHKILRGNIIAVGKFDLGASTISVQKSKLKPSIHIADRSPVKAVQTYLYWPEGRSEPILVDDSGLYPVISTPIFQISAAGKGNGLLEVVPFLNYQKGGKALKKSQLREFWGE